MKQIFYEGDEVKHPDFGLGVVDSINDRNTHPVCVYFVTVGYRPFTMDGRFNSEASPSLTFRDGTQFNYGTPPALKWVPTEACWARVWDSGNGSDAGSLLKFIVGYKEDRSYSYIDRDGLYWKHAAPCDAPEWKGDRE